MNYLNKILEPKLKNDDVISHIYLFLIPLNKDKQIINLIIYLDNLPCYEVPLYYHDFIDKISSTILIKYIKYKLNKIIPASLRDMDIMVNLDKYKDIIEENQLLLFQIMIELHKLFNKEKEFTVYQFSFYFELNENCYNICKKYIKL